MEPKRFEDMVRQLAYDFKPWRQLEATGRSGGDAGFDIRGFEIVPSPLGPIDEFADDDTSDETGLDRLWLIQCKRERSIGPAAMKKSLSEIAEDSRTGLHGIIFAAACDFSLATRNAFREWCGTNSISECIIWGRGELEDLLFQPKNDGLLFAYFGISLRVRRQRVATELRREIALKRKFMRLFPREVGHGEPIILRDPSDARYPFVDGKTLKEGKSLWLPRRTLGAGTFGLRVVLREFWAFYDWKTERWDIASAIDFSIPDDHENPWYQFQIEPGRDEIAQKIVKLWQQFPRGDQCFFRVVGNIEYQDIIEVDDVGSHSLKTPTIYVVFKNGAPPYSQHTKIIIEMSGYGGFGEFDPAKHAAVFPDDLRSLSWEKSFFEDYEIKRSTEPFAVTLTEPEWKK